MTPIYIDNIAIYDFEDEGHTGKLHDAETPEDCHFGMFIFDLGEGHEKYISYYLTLYVKSLESNVSDGVDIFTVIPGVINNPENIEGQTFIGQESLDACGWVPVTLVNRAGESYVLEKSVSLPIPNRLMLEFVFTAEERYFGFLIKPCVTDIDGSGEHFSLEFYHPNALFGKKPVLKCQPAVVSFSLSDRLSGSDETRYFEPDILEKVDFVGVHEHTNIQSMLDFADTGKLSDGRHDGLRIRGTDPSVNYSMMINHIAVNDKGRVIEVYGFNGYTERYYYPDFFRYLEKADIKKLNVVTWSGLLVEFPWAAMLWYGEIIYFADLEEFGECCRLYFKEHGDDECPVCGNPLGQQLSFSYIDVMRIPHQLYFCSHECLKRFTSHIKIYADRVTKPNVEYITKIDI